MSRTTQQEILENPCKKFLKWKTIKETIIVDGDEVEKLKGGTWQYWDKEKETNIDVKLPLEFAILNQDLVTFKGYDEKNKRGVWSNEVKDKDHLVVLKAKDEKLLSFKLSEYKVNKDAIQGFGGKYTKSVYIGVNVDGKWEIWNLQLSGAALTGAIDMENPSPDEKQDGWFGFTKANKFSLYSNYIVVEGFKPKKKGSSKFTIPVYTLGGTIDDDVSAELNALDGELNKYLAYYFHRPDEIATPVEVSVQDDSDVTDY